MQSLDNDFERYYEKNQGKPSEHMEIVRHNNKVKADISKRRLTKCPKNCGYIDRERYIDEICLFCYDESKFKQNPLK